jgi:heme exporter protein B
MPSFFQQATAILLKDLKTELRTKERLSAMVFFGFLVLLIFNFAFKPGSPIMQTAASGIFWISVTFAGLLGLTRSFTMECENDCMMGLLLSPADRGAIFLGKMLANFTTMICMEALMLPLLEIFLNIPVLNHLHRLVLPLFLGTLGFASIGTLFAAMSINTRLKEALLPMLSLPVLIPALLAAVETFRAILAGEPLSEVGAWLKLGGAFALLFTTACLMLFDYVVEE